jgi:hypothetical protein
MTYSPCRHCQDRHIGCHNPETCIRWAVACQINKADTKARQNKAGKEIAGYLCTAKKHIFRTSRHCNINGK